MVRRNSGDNNGSDTIEKSFCAVISGAAVLFVESGLGVVICGLAQIT